MQRTGKNSVVSLSISSVYIIKTPGVGLTKYFTILDENDSTGLIKEAMKEISIDLTI